MRLAEVLREVEGEMFYRILRETLRLRGYKGPCPSFYAPRIEYPRDVLEAGRLTNAVVREVESTVQKAVDLVIEGWVKTGVIE